MNRSEWPLIAFTLLGQLAAGMFLISMVLRVWMSRTDRTEAVRLTSRPLFWTGPILLMAMLASLLHLGSPLGALQAVSNIRISWLSREIALAAGFFATWAIGTWWESRKADAGAPKAWHWLTAGLGLATVFSMAQVYSTSVVPAWTTFFTLTSFFTTTSLLGSLASAAFVVRSKQEGQTPIFVALGLVAAASVAVQLLATPLYLGLLGNGNGPAQASLAILVGPLSITMGARLVLAVVTAGILGLSLWWRATRSEKPISLSVMYGVFALALVSELVGRYLFYASGIPVLPG